MIRLTENHKKMNIQVKRKTEAEKIERFSTAHYVLEFPSAEDVFNIPIVLLPELSAYFEPYFPANKDEKDVKDFMLDMKAEE